MLSNLQKFSESIVEKSKCDKCAEGPHICTKPNSKTVNKSNLNRQSFLFWFDVCREKWLFLGTQKSSALDGTIPQNCEQPTVYSDMERVTKMISFFRYSFFSR